MISMWRLKGSQPTCKVVVGDSKVYLPNMETTTRSRSVAFWAVYSKGGGKLKRFRQTQGAERAMTKTKSGHSLRVMVMMMIEEHYGWLLMCPGGWIDSDCGRTLEVT